MHPLREDEDICPQCGHNRKDEVKIEGHLPGCVLRDQYIVGKMLGRGGFGITYIGRDLFLDRVVAIKEYFPIGLAYRSSDMTVNAYTDETDRQDRFERGKKRAIAEARTIVRMNALPNVVHIYNAFAANGTVYIVMEYITGETLSCRIVRQGRPFGWEEASNLLLPLLTDLQRIHEANIIHRDISPDNIMIRRESGTAVLLDFGAAHNFSDDAAVETTSLRVGYAPMEQYTTSLAGQDGRTDEYAFCATLYYALTARKPADAMARFGGVKLPIPSDLGSDIDPNSEAVLMRGLSVKKEDRYGSVRELNEAFELARLDPTIPDLPDLPAAPASGAAAPIAAEDEGETVHTEPVEITSGAIAKERKTGPAVIIVIGAMVIVATAGGMLLASRMNEPKPSPAILETLEPSEAPTPEITLEPTAEPTATPTAAPTNTPTAAPTAAPTVQPTAAPTDETIIGQQTEAQTGRTRVQAKLYKDAGENAGSKGSIPEGAKIVVHEARTTDDGVEWYRVTRMGEENEGWVHAKTVTLDEAAAVIWTASPETTAEPTATPTAEPTATPTAEPTATPTAEPTATPTAEPTATPTAEPTATPTAEPTATPTAEPTATPTAEPTATPTAEPTATPTAEPTATPAAEPTATPTAEPTVEPTPIVRSEAEEAEELVQQGIALRNEGGQDEQAAVCFMKAAQMGNQTAQLWLGECYEKGIGVEQNAQSAFEWYSKSAEQGNDLAKECVAACCQNGIGVDQDYEQAVLLYQQVNFGGRNQENIDACNDVLDMERQADEAIEKKSMSQGAKLYKKAAEKGSAYAQYRYGYFCENGLGDVNKSAKNAMDWYLKAAAMGNAQAQYAAGHLYEEGKGGIKQDIQAAGEMYRMAAERKHAPALYRLGCLYENGALEKENDEQVLGLYTAAAELGEPSAQLRLAQAAENGELGMEKNLAEAAGYYSLAAEQNIAQAMYDWARFIENGYGDVKQDEALAMQWYRKAAEAGQAQAMYLLGVLSEMGNADTPPMEKDALQWYQKAADAGNAEAQYALGRFYENGLGGLQKNMTRAVKLYKQAAEQNNLDALITLGEYYSNGQNADQSKADEYYEKAAEFCGPEKCYEIGLAMESEGREEKRYMVWYQKAADNGYAPAQYKVGAYQEEHGTRAKMLEYYQKAADSGYAPAQYRMGLQYECEGGVRNLQTAKEEYQKAAEQNYAPAQYAMGRFCEKEGAGNRQKEEMALSWYRLAAEQGNAPAQCAVGRFYENGMAGLDRNEAKAIEWYTLGQDDDSVDVQYVMAHRYLKGIGVARDVQEAVSRYETADKAKQQYRPFDMTEDYCEIAACYETGDGVGQSDVKMFAWLHQADEMGKISSDSMTKLGICYLNGTGVKKDIQKAASCFEDAATMYTGRNAEALYYLSYLYEHGYDQFISYEFIPYLESAELGYEKAVEKVLEMMDSGTGDVMGINKERAIWGLKMAAKNGNAHAQRVVGEWYQNGTLLDKDEQKALELYQRAAEQGDVQAMFLLGECYENGLDDVEPDEALAMRWYRKAAEAGDARAMYRLGVFSETGNIDSPPMENVAVQWYQKAADLGDADAQYALGRFYQNGLGGMPKDEEKALELSKLAAEQDHAEALKALDQADSPEQNDETAEQMDDVEPLQPDDNREETAETEDSLRFLADHIEEYAEEAWKNYFSFGSMVLEENQEELLQRAEAGEAWAQYGYGVSLGGWSDEGVKWLEEAAKQDYVPAQGILAEVYALFSGYQDQEKAEYWAQKAAEQGSARGMYAAGLLTADAQKSTEWMNKAAKLENADAQCYLGINSSDEKEAVRWLKKAAGNQNVSAMNTLGRWYEFGEEGLAQSDVQALRWYQGAVEASKAGSEIAPESYAALARFYQEGRATKKDLRQAARLYQAATEYGVLDAHGKVAEVAKQLVKTSKIQLDELNEANIEEYVDEAAAYCAGDAWIWIAANAEKLKNLAESGEAWAQFGYGCEMYLIDNEQRWLSLSVQWIAKAANQGFVPAQMWLVSYERAKEDGAESRIDEEQAHQWVQAACEQGNAHAQYLMARICEDHDQIDESVQHDLLAAKGGYTPAYESLGMAYEYGYGIARDLTKALECYHQGMEKTDDRNGYFAQMWKKLRFKMRYENGYWQE